MEDINMCFPLRGKRAKFKMHYSRPFRGINIRLDVEERGLKWAWLFQMKTFSPRILLVLTLAVCSVTLLNWRPLRVLKWARGDVEIMPVLDLARGPCQVCAPIIFTSN